jgi:hypothetical protein
MKFDNNINLRPDGRPTLHSWQKQGSVIGLLVGVRKHALPTEQFVDGRPATGLGAIVEVISAKAASPGAMLPMLAKIAGLLPTHTRRSEDLVRQHRPSLCRSGDHGRVGVRRTRLRNLGLEAARSERHTSSAWRPRSGSMVNHRTLTSAMIDSRDFLAAKRRAETEVPVPAGPNIAVTGGLDVNDHRLIWDRLDHLHAKHPDMVLLHGGSPKGADRIAARCADHRKVPQIAFKPDWTKHAKAAPFKRIDAILEVLPIRVMLFPGTGIQKNPADRAKKVGIPVWKFGSRGLAAHGKFSIEAPRWGDTYAEAPKDALAQTRVWTWAAAQRLGPAAGQGGTWPSHCRDNWVLRRQGQHPGRTPGDRPSTLLATERADTPRLRREQRYARGEPTGDCSRPHGHGRN